MWVQLGQHVGTAPGELLDARGQIDGLIAEHLVDGSICNATRHAPPRQLLPDAARCRPAAREPRPHELPRICLVVNEANLYEALDLPVDLGCGVTVASKPAPQLRRC